MPTAAPYPHEGPRSLFEGQAGFPYTVRLDAFQGPLDLLLHLIRKNEVEICDIPIATITRQYLEYLDLMKEMNLEVAGEFLVMASTLLQIKSKMLLPTCEEDEQNSEEEQDPRAELVRRLMEYQRYKDAAQLIAARELLGRDVFTRPSSADNPGSTPEPDQPLELEIFELVEAFRRVLSQVPFETFHDVISETISIAERIGRILDLLDQSDTVMFDEIFREEQLSREMIIATFLGLLELCRLNTVKVVQSHPFGGITLIRLNVKDARENSDVYH